MTTPNNHFEFIQVDPATATTANPPTIVQDVSWLYESRGLPAPTLCDTFTVAVTQFGEVAGAVQARREDEKIWVSRLATAQRFGNLGLGTLLLGQTAAATGQPDQTIVELSVTDVATGFYEKIGFQHAPEYSIPGIYEVMFSTVGALKHAAAQRQKRQ